MINWKDDAIAREQAKIKIARTSSEMAALRDLFEAVETAIVNHKGPAIDRLRRSYEALTESRQ